ncbi:hypothetical protein QE375_003656 [Microbacterium foliorum]|uniref:Carbamate kinase n=1 Tax=Microbacterium foliorum TaxID=104336 RepID=A0ABU1HWB1_9MICO|nr:hypothetical protein [Microbacterium foliorum]
MRLIIALGGNALLHRDERPDAAVQMARLALTAPSLARIATDHQVAFVHGNGPQVGLLARESAEDETLAAPYPLSALGAQTQGLIGSLLPQAIHNVHRRAQRCLRRPQSEQSPVAWTRRRADQGSHSKGSTPVLLDSAHGSHCLPEQLRWAAFRGDDPPEDVEGDGLLRSAVTVRRDRLRDGGVLSTRSTPQPLTSIATAIATILNAPAYQSPCTTPLRTSTLAPFSTCDSAGSWTLTRH